MNNPQDIARDYRDMSDFVWQNGGFRASLLGRKHWSALADEVVAEMPTYLASEKTVTGNWGKKRWAEHSYLNWRNKNPTLDPITILLISIAAKLIVELILRWLDNRGVSRERRLSIRDFVLRNRIAP